MSINNFSLKVKVNFNKTIYYFSKKNVIPIDDTMLKEKDWLEKKRNLLKKALSNRFQDIINWSIKSGNNHFAITINILEYDLTFGVDVTEYYNEIKDIIFKNFPSTTYLIVVSEENKLGNIHFHAIVGIRNFIDYNYTLLNNLRKVLNNEFSTDRHYYGKFSYLHDIKVQPLLFFKDIKNWFVYIYKDMFIWLYEAYIYLSEFDMYDNMFLENTKWNKIHEHLWLNEWSCTDQSFPIYQNFIYIEHNSLNEINGIILNKNKITQKTLLNIIQYYLILNNLFVYGNYIYKKVPNYKISYEEVGTIKSVLFDNFQKNIMNFFLEKYNNYFNGFDFIDLISMYLHQSKDIIQEIYDITTNRIYPDFTTVEFSDGIYSFKYRRFIKKNDIKDLNISTIKFYRNSYSWTRQCIPNVWISNVLNVIGFKGNIQNELKTLFQMENGGIILGKTGNIEFDYFIQVCYYISLIFRDKIQSKKKFLFLLGITNSGKTTLVTKVLENYLGQESIGRIVSGNTFQFQDLINKKVLIAEEFELDKELKGVMLKLLGGEEVLISKKYEKEPKYTIKLWFSY